MKPLQDAPSRARPLLNVITCSTRPGRIGPVVAEWVQAQARKHDAFDVVPCDLQEFALPILDEPEHPRLKKYLHAHTHRWSEAIDAADAFVFVMPEYNFGPPASLVNAMNYLAAEWAYKPAGFVSYGGMSGGIRAVQVAKQLMTTQKLVPLLEAVAFPFVAQQIDSDRRLSATPLHEQAAAAMFTELGRWSRALRPLRSSDI